MLRQIYNRGYYGIYTNCVCMRVATKKKNKHKEEGNEITRLLDYWVWQTERYANKGFDKTIEP